MVKFHEKEFDDVTQIKLALFRLYIREWLSVFMTYRHTDQFWIFDYFSGPGKDSQGNPGSPLIIWEEIQNYQKTRVKQWNQNMYPHLLFNDINSGYIDLLKKEFEEKEDNIQIHFRNMPFDEIFLQTTEILQDPQIPCLAIMDQFGIKAVDQDVLQTFWNSPKTDMLFFITSSILKRFRKEECIQKHLPIKEDVDKIAPKHIHRAVTDFFRSLVPPNTNYYLAPFSLKKGANVYGIIFGTGNLYGLEKFLNCAWKIDAQTGEANINIDNDMEKGQLGLFKEFNQPKKVNYFQDELWKFLAVERSNTYLYEFTLTKGFLPKHIREILRNLQDRDKIEVRSSSESQIRKGAFYIGHNSPHKIYIRRKGVS